MKPISAQIFLQFRESRYFTGVSNENLTEIVNLSKMTTFEKDAIILDQNIKNDSVYFILKGVVSVKVDGEFLYNLARVGDIFGEMSVITDELTSASVVAHTKVRMIVIEVKVLKEINTNSSHHLHFVIYQWFSKILSDKLKLTSQRAKQHEILNNQLNTDLERIKETADLLYLNSVEKIECFPLTFKNEFADELGGDLFGVFKIDEEHYAILIGDVSGHGTDACIQSVIALSLFQSVSTQYNSSAEALKFVNNKSVDFMPNNKFVTAFYGIYNTVNSSITYTTAGHHPTLVLRGNEVLQMPITTGLPIAIFKDDVVQYGEKSFVFEQGDRMMLFTDAIFESIVLEKECTANQKEMSTFDMIVDFIKNNLALSSKDLIDAIYTYNSSFNGGVFNDDFTLMIFDQN